MAIALHWSDIDPDHIWRAPTPRHDARNSVEANEPMMRPMHTSSSFSSLSALQQLPSGSNGAGFSCAPSPSQRTTRPSTRNAHQNKNNTSNHFEEQLMEDFQNALLFRNDLQTAPGLGIGPMNPWQLSSALGSINGFTSSDSSAPLSPISQYSSDPRKRSAKCQGVLHSRRPQNQSNTSSVASHRPRVSTQPTLQRNPGPQMANNATKVGHHRSENYQPGMRDLTYWLKKLRLHKYTPLFEKMTYMEIMSLDVSMLEKMKVTTGARKKIMQSIEKLRERPIVLKNMEEELRGNRQCIRCAICAIRQMLWSPFIRYEGNTKNREIIDGLNVPLHMISNDNIPALIFRVVAIINSMVFPLGEDIRDLEDEYLLTMFYIFDSIIKNEQFTPNQQHCAALMKRNAKKYASPEEMRRHRMGMVSSSKCESCHNAEVVNRERMIEMQEKQARGELLSMPSYSLFFDQLLDNSLNLSPATTNSNENMMSTYSKMIMDIPSSSSSSSSNNLVEDVAPKNLFNFTNIWSNNVDVLDDHMSQEPSTSFAAPPVSMYPQYRSPNHVDTAAEEVSTTPTDGQYTNVMNQATFDFLEVLRGIPETINIDFSFPDHDLPGLKKANSTGSGYSSSESESSVISPRSRSTSDDNASTLTPRTPTNPNFSTSPSILNPFNYHHPHPTFYPLL